MRGEIAMPMITVSYASPVVQPGLKAKIAAAVAKASTDILRKDPKVTAVLVEEAAAEDWFCGGASLANQKLASFWLDIHVVDGTNTKDEKADFIGVVFKTMGGLLGPLHTESYVHVHDVRADAYGYGGVTQEQRKLALAASRFDVPLKAFAAGQVLT
jgi:4-oxalocrotonate tautomerase